MNQLYSTGQLAGAEVCRDLSVELLQAVQQIL